MRLGTVLGAILIALLVITPVAGFAAGEAPRDLGGHHGAPGQLAWKTVPATTTPPAAPGPRLALLERLTAGDPRLPVFPASRPPFVPPRSASLPRALRHVSEKEFVGAAGEIRRPAWRVQMLGFGKVTCGICKAQVRRHDARKAQDGSGFCICDGCYAAWEQSGRQCAACASAVRGLQGVGLFSDRSGLGHTDCGGARLLRA